MSEDKYMEILKEIAYCDIAKSILCDDKDSSKQDCSKIVLSQNSKSYNEWHLSEPWVGNPSTARIVYISSNPSYDKDENFPNHDCINWNDDKVVDFFVNRFADNKYVTIKRNGNGNYDFSIISKGGSKSVKFWNSISSYSKRILQKDDIQHGIDYLMTEIVHCKSQNEVGLSDKCIKRCMNRYLKKIIDVCSSAKCFILVGKKSLKYASRIFVNDTRYSSYEELENDLLVDITKDKNYVVKLNSDRYLCWIPHPSSRQLRKAIIDKQIDSLRMILDSTSV